jgi:colanic acid biosynthesis glycosyl transferase WcaI
MAHVLIYSLVFPPDGVSTAQIMGELAVDLKRLGHTVGVVTTQPHYNRDDIARAAQPLSPRWGGMIFRSTFHDVLVYHTRMSQKRAGIRARLAGWLTFHLLGLAVALRYFRTTDVVLIPSPLLSAGAVGWLFGLLTGARYIYNVQELYPDLGVQMGRLRNPALIGVLRVLERFVYRSASAITVISRGMERKVAARGQAGSKVHYIPNFVDVTQLCPTMRDNAFRREQGLGEAFIVSYAGNIGYAQGLEVLLDAADRLRFDPSIMVLFIGNGVARRDLQEYASARQLPNVRFVEHQPVARVPEIYAASDLCIVPLLDSIGADAIPSKAYRIMACARPILAIAAATSELAEVVRESGGGMIVGQDAAAIAEAIRQHAAMSPDRRRELGEAGRRYAAAHVSRAAVTRQYSDLVSTFERPSRA